MGYWDANERGGLTFPYQVLNDDGIDRVWGDTPADAFDEALNKIIKAFNGDMLRPPTAQEIRSGLEFSMGVLIDDGLVVDNEKKA